MVAGVEGMQQDQGLVTNHTLQPYLKTGEIKKDTLLMQIFIQASDDPPVYPCDMLSSVA